ncbi:hypothetical protein GGR52DRAFT_552651 [Hypoxylon sp. FL1284]|nr:hypothetical protein GGR52DRAFT_552651 [Hypoxylon sp. FL1284]
MKSVPSVNTVRPRWWHDVTWNISEPFEVEWLCKVHVDNTHIQHISNSLSQDYSVIRARDGQQVDAQAGRRMIAIIESRALQRGRRSDTWKA